VGPRCGSSPIEWASPPRGALWGAPAGRSPVAALRYTPAARPHLTFGQLAASSTGFLAEPYAAELARLLDEVPPESFAVVRRAVEEDLDAPLEKVFAEFDPEPLAAASIAQVHVARLQDGTDVVVKVQRPGLAEIVERDMHHMRMITRTLEPDSVVGRTPPGRSRIADAAREVMILELEADMERYARSRSRWATTTSWSLGSTALARGGDARERLHGIKISDFERIRRGADPEGLPPAAAVLMQAFASRFLPRTHAGTAARTDGYLTSTGKFDAASRGRIFRYMQAFAIADVQGLVGPLQEMGAIPAGTPVEEVIHDLRALYAPFFTRNYRDIRYEEIFPAFMRGAARHGWSFPREFTLLTKQMLYFDRYAKALAPDVNLFTDPRVVSFLQDAMAAAG
jgi:ubiquinone biosynthesis protein